MRHTSTVSFPILPKKELTDFIFNKRHIKFLQLIMLLQYVLVYTDLVKFNKKYFCLELDCNLQNLFCSRVNQFPILAHCAVLPSRPKNGSNYDACPTFFKENNYSFQQSRLERFANGKT